LRRGEEIGLKTILVEKKVTKNFSDYMDGREAIYFFFDHKVGKSCGVELPFQSHCVRSRDDSRSFFFGVCVCVCVGGGHVRRYGVARKFFGASWEGEDMTRKFLT
jgi:hypothetical protein